MRTTSIMIAALGLLALAAPAAAQQRTIRAGMTEAEVRAAWGEPLTLRQHGTSTFLFYRSDCQQRCGTHDLAILEGGKLVDAIARSSDHRYEGAPARPPAYTPPTSTPATGTQPR